MHTLQKNIFNAFIKFDITFNYLLIYKRVLIASFK